MSNPKRKAARKTPSSEARTAAHAEKSRLAMQRASSVKALRKPPEDDGASPKGRKGRKGVVIYLSPEAKEQLARLAHTHRKTMQAIGADAINLLFEANRLKPIA
ncbi:MAG: ribbon-helix-helix domain-containing protein [Hyphomicrobiaceae bacterium]